MTVYCEWKLNLNVYNPFKYVKGNEICLYWRKIFYEFLGVSFFYYHRCPAWKNCYSMENKIVKVGSNISC